MLNVEKISIIIPVYNTEKYIKKCLNSVINQTYKNIEIIIINDGSTDNTEEEIKKYEFDHRIKYIKQKNSGVSGARNNGLKIATGKYVTFVDSDDWIELNMIEKLLKKAIETNSDFVICGIMNIYPNGKKEINYIPKIIDLKNIVERSYSWNKLIKVDLFKKNKIKFPEGELYEDLGTIPYIFFKSKNPVCLEDILYNYYQRETSITKIVTEKSFDIIKQYIKLKNFLIDNNLLLKYEEDYKYLIKNFKKIYICNLATLDFFLAIKLYRKTYSFLKKMTTLKINDYIYFIIFYFYIRLKKMKRSNF